MDTVPVARYVPALRVKMTHVFFPDEVLPIFSFAHLTHFLSELGVEWKNSKGVYAATANHRLLDNIRKITTLSGWGTTELGYLLYKWSAPPKEIAGPTSEEKNEKMNQPEAVLKAMRELIEMDPQKNAVVGPDQVKAYVLENYGINIAACATVMADMVAPSHSIQNQTSKVSLHLRQLERVRPGGYRLLPDPNERIKDETSATSSTQAMSVVALNQILYGPPGTGKTYSVIREAARIVSGQLLDDRQAKKQYDALAQQGRIRLATFHQSFSYEDFIEGIRPVMDESGAARFEVRDGVFKEVATEALFACLEAVTKTPGDSGFEAYWSALLAKIADAGELEIPGLKDVTWIMSETEKGNLRAVNKESQKELTCGRSAMTKVWQALRPKERASSMDVSTALGRGAHFGVIAAVYNYLQNLKPQVDAPTQSDLPLPNSSSPGTNKGAITESFLELGPASGWQLRADRIFPPYVLIIDEINRGNISRIFGELITLIEDDKRHGEENALEVTLPTSREPFTVPPNLYLLGTMNTADKSLALLDVALRRRFDFRELAPNFALCPTLPAAMQAVLMRLNDRLELRKDRDHRIGHAFFMAVADEAAFNTVFCRKVVPLLQEYFFNDADGARYVLGEEGRQDAAGFLRPLIGDSKWQRNRWRWFTDVEPSMDCWARLQVTLGTAEA